MLTQKKKQFLLLACTGMLLQLPLPQIGWAANPTDEIHYYSNTYALTQDGSNYANDGAAGYYAMAIGGEAKAVGNWSIAIGNLAACSRKNRTWLNQDAAAFAHSEEDFGSR